VLIRIGNVPVDSEATAVTLSISRFADPTQIFGGAHRERRRARRQRDVCGDFVNLEIYQSNSVSSEVLIGTGVRTCVYMG
jgi:hypothetical protein